MHGPHILKVAALNDVFLPQKDIIWRYFILQMNDYFTKQG